jgi:fatty acid desaturase
VVLAFIEQGLSYDRAQATVNGTVTLLLPHWLEVLLHHANYRLPQQMSLSIPSYRCKGAQEYLQQRLGQYLTIAELNPKLLLNLMTAWLVYDTERNEYVDFEEAYQRTGGGERGGEGMGGEAVGAV